MSALSSPQRHYPELDGKTFLVCVGAAKCATSWLHAYLDATPGVVVSPLKELHFFNRAHPGLALADMDALALSRLEFHMNQSGNPVQNLRDRPAFQASLDRVQMIYDDDAYFGHFARLCGPETRSFADLTPSYSVLRHDGFASMKAFCASQNIRLRVLFVMRDPVDRLWSQIRHMEQINSDSHLTEDWQSALKDPALLARADYKGIVTALDATFAPRDLLYLFYETLFDEGSLTHLRTFANAPSAPAEHPGRRNETKVTQPLPDPVRHTLTNGLAPQYAFCRDRFGDLVPASWQG